MSEFEFQAKGPHFIHLKLTPFMLLIPIYCFTPRMLTCLRHWDVQCYWMRSALHSLPLACSRFGEVPQLFAWTSALGISLSRLLLLARVVCFLAFLALFSHTVPLLHKVLGCSAQLSCSKLQLPIIDLTLTSLIVVDLSKILQIESQWDQGLCFRPARLPWIPQAWFH